MSASLDPEALAAAYLQAVGDGAWADAASLVHADVVARVLQPFVANGLSEEAIGHIFAGVRTRSELASMSPIEAFARLMEAFASSTNEHQTPQPRRLERIVGCVNQDPDAYVLYFARWEPEQISVPRVLVLRRGTKGWGVLPTTEALKPPPATVFVDPFMTEW